MVEIGTRGVFNQKCLISDTCTFTRLRGLEFMKYVFSVGPRRNSEEGPLCPTRLFKISVQQAVEAVDTGRIPTTEKHTIRCNYCSKTSGFDVDTHTDFNFEKAVREARLAFLAGVKGLTFSSVVTE